MFSLERSAGEGVALAKDAFPVFDPRGRQWFAIFDQQNVFGPLEERLVGPFNPAHRQVPLAYRATWFPGTVLCARSDLQHCIVLHGKKWGMPLSFNRA